MSEANRDELTIAGFGEEWSAYDQRAFSGAEFDRWFESYFAIFPFDELPAASEGFDLGCGSGRWALLVAPRVGKLHCIDPAEKALDVARARLSDHDNVEFHLASANDMPIADGSQDFGYSLGVLHHIPDTKRALKDAVRKLRQGAPFLLYLYYRFDHRPWWFKAIWKATDIARRGTARLPFPLRKAVSTTVAAFIYWPLARSARLVEKAGGNPAPIPLSAYRESSFYMMRTDALDRFGTRLEHRFTRPEIEQMMREAGLVDIRFSDREPFWVACGRKG